MKTHLRAGFFFSATLAAAVPCLCSLTEARAQTNVIQNSGFEGGGVNNLGVPVVVLANGNNIGVVPNNWMVTAGTTASNSNLQQGNATSGGITLAPYNGTYSGGSTGTTGGTHFWDGTATGTNNAFLTQQFTLTSGSTYNLSGSFALGGRDAGAATVNSSITIANVGGTAFSQTFSGSTTDGNWTVTPIAVSTPVPAGTYSLTISLAEFQNVDAVNLIASPIPEPSTWAMLAAGGLGMMALLVQRRARRTAKVG